MKTNYLFNLHLLQRICVVLLIGSGALGLFGGATVNAANAVTAPWNGSGTEADPYLVRSATDLQSLSDFCRNGNATKGYFWLMSQDIDMSSITNFTPIGGRDLNNNASSNNFFQGTFDGGGHVISHLTIDNPSYIFYTGLFGWVASGTIRNLGIVDANVKGGFYTGILSGMNIGKIYNCYTTGTVNGINNTGGLTGYIASQGTGSFGSGWGQIYNCYTTAQVVAGSNGDTAYFGTFAGGGDKATISNCFATGTIDGQVTKGGFVGQASGSTFTNCHFRQETGVNENLAFIGKVNTANTLSNSDAKTGADMQLANFVSELNGSTGEILWTSKSSVNNGYPILFYQAGIRTITYSANGATNTMPVQLVGENIATRLLTNTFIPATLQRSANWKVTTSTATNITVGTVFDNNALITLNGGNITLEPQWENLSGDGSETNPYQISSPADLRALSNYVMGGNNCSDTYFIMTADIDMANERDFIPIGGHESLIQSNGNIVFEGNFSGGNHVIRNLILNMPNSDYVGLFGAIGVNANIKNLGIAQAHITASGTAGVVAGLSRGTISSCYADATVLSNGYQGVLAGLCYGTINNCYATGSLTGNQYTGGLAGGLAGIIKNCYSAVSIHDTNGGGLAGYFFGNANLTNCYYLQEQGGVNDGLAVVGTNVYGTINNTMPKTGTELKDAAMVTTLNDEPTALQWRSDLSPTINQGFPILLWQGPVCVISYKAGSGGSGSMSDLTLMTGSTATLYANSFTVPKGIGFENWKVTASTVSGVHTGDTYTNKQQITAGEGIIELTAQWKTYFSKGDGTESAPYLIETSNDLVGLSNYVNNGGETENVYWLLTNNLDMNGITNFTPIADSYNGTNTDPTGFGGTFDGGNHTITNLKISYTGSTETLGLFGLLSEVATVKNLGIGTGSSISVTVEGTDENSEGVIAGVIAGMNSGGKISGCFSRANLNITGGNYNFAGSIAGFNTGIIQNCFATGNVTVNSGAGSFAGGLIGYNTHDYANGQISNSYFAGNVSISTGTDNSAGGICGNNESQVQNCYYLQDTGINAGIQGNGDGNSDGITAKNTVQLKSNDMVPALNGSKYFTGWIADTNNSNMGYPLFTTGVYTWDWQGDGSATTPWLITNADQLTELSEYINAGFTTTNYFWKLNNDIDMSSIANFEGIGDYKNYLIFDGELDGNGHLINNLKINNTTDKYYMHIGLFSMLSDNAVVKNLGIGSGSSIVVTLTDGTVLMGAIAGSNNGQIISCFSNASVRVNTGNYNSCGSLVGENDGVIDNCYSNGDVTADSNQQHNTGGLVGSIYPDGSISNSYYAGKVSNINNNVNEAGAIAGSSSSAVTNCYYLQDTGINEGISGIFAGNYVGSTAKTSTELKDVAMVTALNDTQLPAPWKADIATAINHGYPVLAWQNAIITGVSVPVADKTSGWILYPNPVRHYFALSGLSTPFTQIRICDLSGRVVRTQQITEGEKVNVSDLNPGVYMVNAEGKTVKIFIISHL